MAGESPKRRTIEELEAENAELRGEVRTLREALKKALGRIEELERAQKRQAAPFSKGKLKPDPKPPGRKPGTDYGPWACRAKPEKIDETLEVPLPSCCPGCEGALEEVKVDEQIQTDLPPIRPITRRFRIHVGRCTCCGRTVRPRHVLQTSDAVGAAAVQIGPNALGLGALLNKGHGLAWAKVAAFFERTFGIKAARSAFCRAALRAGSRLEPTYQGLVEAAREMGCFHSRRSTS